MTVVDESKAHAIRILVEKTLSVMLKGQMYENEEVPTFLLLVDLPDENLVLSNTPPEDFDKLAKVLERLSKMVRSELKPAKGEQIN